MATPGPQSTSAQGARQHSERRTPFPPHHVSKPCERVRVRVVLCRRVACVQVVSDIKELEAVFDPAKPLTFAVQYDCVPPLTWKQSYKELEVTIQCVVMQGRREATTGQLGGAGTPWEMGRVRCRAVDARADVLCCVCVGWVVVVQGHGRLHDGRSGGGGPRQAAAQGEGTPQGGGRARAAAGEAGRSAPHAREQGGPQAVLLAGSLGPTRRAWCDELARAHEQGGAAA